MVKTDDYTFIVNIYSVKDKFVEKKETYDFNKRQEKIINYLKSNRKINTAMCAELLDVSSDTALRELTSLKAKGVIAKKGIGRVTYYILE